MSTGVRKTRVRNFLSVAPSQPYEHTALDMIGGILGSSD
ncbi:hypothetical protein SBA3_3150006 [Candidatus Sulfopaludibacter sp. SbA3]|nr:hypothetical protein SBA3_3150006 [Candidatus Sulfopaludibacter sp. SbA3]